MSPLDYWPQDPNGWLRHLIVGLLMGAIIVRFKLGNIWLLVAILIAIGKEFFDSFIEWQDIAWTIGGVFFIKLLRP